MRKESRKMKVRSLRKSARKTNSIAAPRTTPRGGVRL